MDDLISKLIQDLNTKYKDADDDNLKPDTWNDYKSMELQLGFQRSMSVDRVYFGGIQGKKNDGGNIRSIARFTFEELCDTDRGAMDYRKIAQSFDIVAVEDVPTLDLDAHNRARRFITLIDELYEGKCVLLCSALNAKTPSDIFQTGKSNKMLNSLKSANNNRDDNIDLLGSSEGRSDEESEILWIDVAQQGGTPVGALASVRELSFAFERASSRIFEMCSRSWWHQVMYSSSSVKAHKHAPMQKISR